jgi:hypothetical protein
LEKNFNACFFQRLHAGEKPFVCSAAGCENRYTHANRQCPDHPFAKPQRTTEIILQPNISASEDRDKVLQWLQKYRREREEKTPGKLPGNALQDDEELNEPPSTSSFYLPTKNLKSKRGLMKEMEQSAEGQENCLLVAAKCDAAAVGRAGANRPPPMLLSAHESFNQALRRAGERLERSAAASTSPILVAAHHMPQDQPPVYLQPASLAARGVENSPQHAALLGGRCSAATLVSTAAMISSNSCSPAKRRPFTCDLVSPMKSIRRTLGDITPTKNCRADMVSDLELPFNFGILQTSPPEPAGGIDTRRLMMPPTPSSSEKSPYYPGGGSSSSGTNSLFGSPALKLKKRFQERFQEERLISDANCGGGGDYFADPIAWTEEDEEVATYSSNKNRVRLSGRYSSGDIANSLLSPPRVSAAGRDGSPTLLVATALVELYESPSRQQQQSNSSSQEIPLNLTKRSYN